MVGEIAYPSIIAPRRKVTLLSRNRLLRIMDRLLDHKLILVVAPAGYGKTSLLVDYARRSDLPVCWYTIDAHEPDIHRFLAHFIQAIIQHYPTVCHELSAQLSRGDPIDVRAFTIALVNELHQQIDERFLIVLDDFDGVCADAAIVQFIQIFLQHMPDLCSLVVIGRKRPRIPGLAVMLERGQVAIVNQNDLGFTTDEIQELARRNYKVNLTPEQAQVLVRSTAGWITGLQLGGPVWWQEQTGAKHSRLTTGLNLESFWDEMLSGLTGPLRDFLLRSSLLEIFSSQRCEQVLRPSIYPEPVDWQQWIDEIQANNLFVQSWGVAGEWLRYHPLMQEYLQRRLVRERPEEARVILRRLATLYIAEEAWDQAHDACRQTADHHLLADLLETCGRSLVRSGQHQKLARWLDELPAGMLEERPYLLSHKGAILQFGNDPQKAIALFDQAIEGLRQGGHPFYLAQTLSRRGNAHHRQGNYRLSLQDGEMLRRLSEDDPALRVHFAESLSLLGFNQFQMGGGQSAVDNLEQALKIYQELGDEYSAASTLQNLGIVHRYSGDFQAAAEAYQHALSFWRKIGIQQVGVDLLNNLAVIHNYLGAYEQAAALLQEGLQIAQAYGYSRSEVYLLTTRCALSRALQDPVSARADCRRALQIARRVGNQQIIGLLQRIEAEYAGQDGDFAKARRLLRQSEDLSEQSGSVNGLAACREVQGRLARIEGNQEQARAELQAAYDIYVAGNWQVEAARTGIHLASVCHQMGDWPAARQVLRDAFERVERKYLQALVEPALQAVSLLEHAGHDPVLRGPAQHLLLLVARFKKNLPTLRRRLLAAAHAEPAEFSVRVLGEMEVRVKTKLITWVNWQSALQREVFVFILHTPQGISRTSFEEHFWSQETDCAKAFSKTIHHIRNQVGNERILFENERYCFNRSLDYEYDAEQFDYLVHQGRNALDPDSRAVNYRQALELYRGLFLPEAAGVWIMDERQRLHRLFVEAATFVVRRSLDRREYQLSLEHGRRALKVDPCLEEIHGLLMRAYAALGDRPAIERQYRWCCQALMERLHLPPTQRTELLYQRLMRA